MVIECLVALMILAPLTFEDKLHELATGKKRNLLILLLKRDVVGNISFQREIIEVYNFRLSNENGILD